MPDAQQTTDCWRQRPPPEQSGTVADSMVSLAPLRTSNRLLLSAHSTNSQLPPWMIPTVGALASSCFHCEKVSSQSTRAFIFKTLKFITGRRDKEQNATCVVLLDI